MDRIKEVSSGPSPAPFELSPLNLDAWPRRLVLYIVLDFDRLVSSPVLCRPKLQCVLYRGRVARHPFGSHPGEADRSAWRVHFSAHKIWTTR
ncbi:uncharacterized protein SPSK_06789 [Sporothrix schenckii 1099-18]|uniref:Uncharacterized protein n=1 Tax=Sporothrix schenckii 1099-18 TaxID=1397361 RepID=A0A0F2MHL6_SPOSC|nr:uncharacterized protein SPSK_06789 [Sporothrix schenckii 1099-18]KJR89188.1 hypothetical protein SPSK_06789 [Sporothrix schenckii 1099-18]